MHKLIIANWKENPVTERRALALFRATAAAARLRRAAAAGISVAVCPPFVFLEQVAGELRRLKPPRPALGAQDVFWEEKGPHTGEVGGKMLRALGAEYVIVGHSERRRWMHETDVAINRKLKRALTDGLRTILCVGEPAAVRRKGIASARHFVEVQLKKDIRGIRGSAAARRVIVAYEPVWAIGTGKRDKPEDAAAMAAFIKRSLRKTAGFAPRVLYGGSVDGKNIRDYISLKEIDGALVGGASLRAGEFADLLDAASAAPRGKNK